MLKTIRFFDLTALALLMGAMFGIWSGYDPMDMPASVYVGQQQAAIRGFNTLLPLMGLLCILLTIAWTIFVRADPKALAICSIAVLCLVAAGLVTRFLNQPINAEVMTWSIGAPPSNWPELRDAWWHWHIVRMILVIGAYALLQALSLTRSDQLSEDAPGPPTAA